MTKVNVLALVPYALGTTPSQRYRLEQWASPLAELGVVVEFSPFAGADLTTLLQRPGHVLRKARLVLSALALRVQRLPTMNHDVIVVHRGACLVGPPIVERRLHALGRHLIYDFDDAIFRLHTSSANRWLGWLKSPGKTAVLCRLSDHVVVCNEFLAAYARERNPRVSIVPSSVDTDQYRPQERPPNARPVIGWMGSSTSQVYLEKAASILGSIVQARPVELRVVSNRPPVLPGVPHKWREWSANAETNELAAFDIGIMPLVDDDWARGKCAFKALQYMAMGVATVASSVGANVEVIQHGRNGLLARDAADWHACLTALVDSPQLRRELGEAGRQTVQEHYSKAQSAAKFERVIREVVGDHSDRG